MKQAGQGYEKMPSLRMEVPRSTELGSVDVQLVGSENVNSLKYYKDGAASARAQAQSSLEETKVCWNPRLMLPLQPTMPRIVLKENLTRCPYHMSRKISQSYFCIGETEHWLCIYLTSSA